MSELISSIVRHVFTYLAGLLSQKDFIGSDHVEDFISWGVLTAVLAWSAIEKRRARGKSDVTP